MTTTNDEGAGDARAALRAAMLDWCEPLTAIASLPDKLCVEPWYLTAWESSQDSSEPVFWLPCQGAVDTPDFRRRMEAAELFALLARVDYALWSELVREVWPEDAQWADFFETRTALCVGLAVECFVGAETIRELSFYMTLQHDLTTSACYKSTRQLMARAKAGDDALLPFVPVRIDHFAHADDYSALVNDLADVLRDFAPDENKQALRVTQLKIDAATHRANRTALDCIKCLQAVGIQVLDLPVVDVQPWGTTVADCAKPLVSILDANALAHSSQDATAGGIEKIVVDRTIHVELVPPILFSASTSRSLRAVEVDMERSGDGEEESEEDAAQDAVRKQIVSLMAFALFRRETPLATVELRARSLFIKDVEWMEEMLTTANPMRVLFPGENDRAQGPRVAQSCRAVLYDPHDQKNAVRQQSWTTDTSMDLDVLGESRDGFIAVLFPGWGRAWVREDQTTFVPKTEASESAFTSPAHLIFREVTAGTMGAVLRLLRMVGRDVKRLELDDCDSTEVPLDAFCTQVLSACPNLEELELCRMELRNFQFLHDAIQADRCRALQKLTLWEIQLREHDAVDQLLTWLATPRERMAVQLRRLRLAPGHLVDSTLLEATLGALSSNARLRDVSLAFRVDQDLRVAYETRFQPLGRSSAFEPLSSRCVCAFLAS